MRVPLRKKAPALRATAVQASAVALLVSASSYAAADMCVRTLELRENERASLAYTNDAGFYVNKGIEIFGQIETDDGSDKVTEIWLHQKDLFRWGVNSTLAKDVGPKLAIDERVSIWAVGEAEIYIRASNTKTRVCLCTRRSTPDDESIEAGRAYMQRREACLKSLGFK